MSEIKKVGSTWMAKCNQLTPLPLKGLNNIWVHCWVLCRCWEVTLSGTAWRWRMWTTQGHISSISAANRTRSTSVTGCQASDFVGNDYWGVSMKRVDGWTAPWEMLNG